MGSRHLNRHLNHACGWGVLALCGMIGVVLWVATSALFPRSGNRPLSDGKGVQSKSGPASVANRAGGETPSTTPTPNDDSDEAAETAAHLLARIERTAAVIARMTARKAALSDIDKEELSEAIRIQCEALKRRLLDAPDEVATEAIIAYLASGRDVETTLDLEVDDGGVLSQATAMRVLMLDVLGTTDPFAAVDYSIMLLDRSASPDEWALALRNIGWQDDGSYRPLLAARLSQLLARDDWRARPTAGYLEAFDLAVHLGDEGALRLMATLAGDRGAGAVQGAAEAAVSHAANLALERMTMIDPRLTVTSIGADADLLAHAPTRRAELMTRADASDPVQAAALADYLRRADLDLAELRAFLGEFPCGSGVMTHALVTSLPPRLEFEENLASDRAALALVNQWIASGAMPRLAHELAAARERLETHIAEGSRSRPVATPATFADQGPARPDP